MFSLGFFMCTCDPARPGVIVPEGRAVVYTSSNQYIRASGPECNKTGTPGNFF